MKADGSLGAWVMSDRLTICCSMVTGGGGLIRGMAGRIRALSDNGSM
jgi:hypothetical protein